MLEERKRREVRLKTRWSDREKEGTWPEKGRGIKQRRGKGKIGGGRRSVACVL